MRRLSRPQCLARLPLGKPDTVTRDEQADLCCPCLPLIGFRSSQRHNNSRERFHAAETPTTTTRPRDLPLPPPPPSPPRHVHSERRRGEVHARPLLLLPPLRGPLKSSEATHTACTREQVVLQQTGDEFRREGRGWCQGMDTSFQGPAAAAAAGCVCLFQTFGQLSASATANACRCIRLPAGTVLSGGGGFFFLPESAGSRRDRQGERQKSADVCRSQTVRCLLGIYFSRGFV